MWADYANARTVTTLTGLVRLRLLIRRADFIERPDASGLSPHPLPAVSQALSS
jgi:hypothetical protein